MPKQLEPRYDHQKAEPEIYKLWEKSGYFNPDNLPDSEKRKPFTIMMPPPNVTGILHMGHALMLTLQDIMIRYARMTGKHALWLPGTDHAAIATQAVVEKEIYKKEGKNRYDIGREALVQRIEEFAQKSHDTIVSQIKTIGASCDWSREAYTLDEKRSLAVRTMFQKMHDDGLIYRGNRIVNWDPKGQTTISDDEIVYEERAGNFYTFRYGKDFPISIATTRPETKVGDVAVAVHPKDERYSKYVGKEYDLEFCDVPLHIKVVADESVDPTFGTGAVGVTPAHSMTDWEIAERHKLPVIQVINEFAKMAIESPTLKDKKTTEAREIIVEWLKSNNLLEKEEQIKQNIATAERTGGVIEPLPKLQWFIDVNKPIPSRNNETLKDIMREPLSNGEIKIIPEHFEKIYFHWIDNLRDWCISRQIWYGHRIPAWFCFKCKAVKVNPIVKARWFLVRHGETDSNKSGLKGRAGIPEDPLNEKGILQIKEAAKQLKSHDIDLIISSDLLRCRMSAEIISKETSAEIIFDESLRERNFGDKLYGMTREERDRQYYNELYSYEGKIEGGESFRDVEDRVWQSILNHRNSNHHKNIVIVTHGGPIRTFLKKLRGQNHDDMLGMTINNAEVVELDVLDPCENCGGDLFEQDPDTLDTWFSSGLWTFSTLGWPDKTQDLKTFHPTDVLETGYEILFFWVARMILMTKYALDDIPFRTVYLHGTVRDAEGRKMSKSLGNGIDPIDVAQKFGTDAGRMALVVGLTPGTDSRISEDKIRGYRNFGTKVWNVARFILMNKPESLIENPTLSETDKTNIAELAELKKEIGDHIEKFDFHLGAEKIYHYIWHTFADKIIEEAKSRLQGDDENEKNAAYQTLEKILTESLKALHPFMPFITEEIYQHLLEEKGKTGLLMIESW